MNTFLTEQELSVIEPIISSKESLLKPCKDYANKNKLIWQKPPASDVAALFELGKLSNTEASLLLNIANKSVRRMKSANGELDINYLAFKELCQYVAKKVNH